MSMYNENSLESDRLHIISDVNQIEFGTDSITTFDVVTTISRTLTFKASTGSETIAYESDVVNQTARIDQLETDVWAHELRLDAIEGDVNFIQSDLLIVEGQLATAQTDIINIENTYLPKIGGFLECKNIIVTDIKNNEIIFEVDTENVTTFMSDCRANQINPETPDSEMKIGNIITSPGFIQIIGVLKITPDRVECKGVNSNNKFSVIKNTGESVISVDSINSKVIIGNTTDSYSLPVVKGVTGQVLTSNGSTTIWSDVSASMSNYLLLTGGTLSGTLNGTIFNGNSLQLKNNGFKTTITASNYDEDCSFIFPNNQLDAQNGWTLKLNNTATGETIWGSPGLALTGGTLSGTLNGTIFNGDSLQLKNNGFKTTVTASNYDEDCSFILPNNQITAQNGWVLKLNNTATGETIWGSNTIQSIYDSATAQIVTSNARGALTIKNGQSLSSDKQLVINNYFDENTFSVSNDSVLLKSYTGPTIVVSSATNLFNQRSNGPGVAPQVQFRLASNYNGNIAGFCSAFNSILATGFSSLNLSYDETTRKFSLFLGYSSYNPLCYIENFFSAFLDITKFSNTAYNTNITYVAPSVVTGYTINNATISPTSSNLPNLTTSALVATSISGTSLTIGGTLITSTSTEINKLTGMTMSTAQLNSIPNLAPLANPSFTGSPRCPNPDVADESDRVANCSFVNTKLVSYAKLLSPQLTGAPTCPTPSAVDNSTRLATTAFVKSSFLDTTLTGTTIINSMKLLNYPKLPGWDMSGYDKDSVSAYFLEKCQPNAPLRTIYLGSGSPAGGLNGCYAAYLGRYYIGPDVHANQALWWYWNCATKAFVSYAHGISGLVASAYRTLCYHAHLNRLYFIPYAIGTTWHYIDGITGALVSYTGVSVVSGAYSFGVYSPLEKRIYLIATNQAIQTNYHYISDTGVVVAYTPSLKTPANYDATYDPLNNRIMISPHQNAHLSVWYYIDCSSGVSDNDKVKSYAHGMTGVSAGSSYGCCFHPILNRIYFLPWDQSTVCYYWDCNTLTISSYNYGQSGGANYIHGIYVPTIGGIFLVPYNKGTQNVWKMIDHQGTVKDVIDTTIWNGIFRGGFYDVENDLALMMPESVNAYIQLQPLTSTRIDKFVMASSMMGN